MLPISVVMLTYNRENIIRRAIESILHQSFTDFEFIIVDNGSDDCSGKIADRFADQDSRIQVIHRDRGNIGSGRNTGLDAACGDFIAFIDDDDWCEPDYLDFLFTMVTKHMADVSICGSFDRQYDDFCLMSAEDALIELFWRRRFNVQFPTKLIRRRLFDGLRFSNSAKYDDIELMPRIIGSASKVVYHGLPKYTFSRHDNNNSAWTTNHRLLESSTLNEYLRVYDERTIWLCKNFPERQSTWKYFRWSFMLSMIDKIIRFSIQGCESQLYSMRLELHENRKEFMRSNLLLDLENEWLLRYIGL